MSASLCAHSLNLGQHSWLTLPTQILASCRGGEKASVHLSYEMVALSPSAAEELGFKLSDEDRKKNFIEMSGRGGE